MAQAARVVCPHRPTHSTQPRSSLTPTPPPPPPVLHPERPPGPALQGHAPQVSRGTLRGPGPEPAGPPAGPPPSPLARAPARPRGPHTRPRPPPPLPPPSPPTPHQDRNAAVPGRPGVRGGRRGLLRRHRARLQRRGALHPLGWVARVGVGLMGSGGRSAGLKGGLRRVGEHRGRRLFSVLLSAPRWPCIAPAAPPPGSAVTSETRYLAADDPEGEFKVVLPRTQVRARGVGGGGGRCQQLGGGCTGHAWCQAPALRVPGWRRGGRDGAPAEQARGGRVSALLPPTDPPPSCPPPRTWSTQ
jgi:hypothetical protein